MRLRGGLCLRNVKWNSRPRRALHRHLDNDLPWLQERWSARHRPPLPSSVSQRVSRGPIDCHARRLCLWRNTVDKLDAVLRAQPLIEALAWIGVGFVVLGATLGLMALLLRVKRLHFSPRPPAASIDGAATNLYADAARAYGRQVPHYSQLVGLPAPADAIEQTPRASDSSRPLRRRRPLEPPVRHAGRPRRRTSRAVVRSVK